MIDSVGGGGRGRRSRVLATLIEGAQLSAPDTWALGTRGANRPFRYPPSPPGHLWGRFSTPPSFSCEVVSGPTIQPPILGPLELGEPIDHSGTPPSPPVIYGAILTPPSNSAPPPTPP